MTDLIDKPAHYVGADGMQVFDVLAQFGLDEHHNRATLITYVIRAGKKASMDPAAKREWPIVAMARSELDDLKKARVYLDREIKDAELHLGSMISLHEGNPDDEVINNRIAAALDQQAAGYRRIIKRLKAQLAKRKARK